MNNIYSKLRLLAATLMVLFGFSAITLAQSYTINTQTMSSSGYSATTSAGSGGTAFITFVLYNNSGSDIKVTEIGRHLTTSHNNSTSTVYYSSTSLSGPVGTLPTTGWTKDDQEVVSVTSTGIVPVNTNMNLIIPDGETYRFAMLTSGTNLYSSSGSPNNFTVNNVSLYAGNYQISGSNVGYGATNNPRYFVGYVTFEPACPAKITTQPMNSSICSGGNAMFNIAATDANTYQWQESADAGNTWSDLSDGGLYSGASTATLLVSGVPASMHGYQYRCVATNTAKSCSKNSDAAELIIVPTSTSSIITLPSDTAICKGQTVTILTAFSKGGNAPTYQWVKNGVDIPGATASSYTSNTIENNDNISVKFTSSMLCVLPSASKGIVFSVGQNNVADVNITTTYLGNNQYQFQAHAVNGGLAPLYQWFKNGKYIPGATGARYVAENIFTSDRFHVELISSDECVKDKVVASKAIGLDVNDITGSIGEFTIAPNPNQGNFTINGTISGSSANTATVEVFNAFGQRLFQKQVVVNNNSVNATIELEGNIPNGIYTLRLGANGLSTQSRFVINR